MSYNPYNNDYIPVGSPPTAAGKDIATENAFQIDLKNTIRIKMNLKLDNSRTDSTFTNDLELNQIWDPIPFIPQMTSIKILDSNYNSKIAFIPTINYGDDGVIERAFTKYDAIEQERIDKLNRNKDTTLILPRESDETRVDLFRKRFFTNTEIYLESLNNQLLKYAEEEQNGNNEIKDKHLSYDDFENNKKKVEKFLKVNADLLESIYFPLNGTIRCLNQIFTIKSKVLNDIRPEFFPVGVLNDNSVEDLQRLNYEPDYYTWTVNLVVEARNNESDEYEGNDGKQSVLDINENKPLESKKSCKQKAKEIVAMWKEVFPHFLKKTLRNNQKSLIKRIGRYTRTSTRAYDEDLIKTPKTDNFPTELKSKELLTWEKRYYLYIQSDVKEDEQNSISGISASVSNSNGGIRTLMGKAKRSFEDYNNARNEIESQLKRDDQSFCNLQRIQELLTALKFKRDKDSYQYEKFTSDLECCSESNSSSSNRYSNCYEIRRKCNENGGAYRVDLQTNVQEYKRKVDMVLELLEKLAGKQPQFLKDDISYHSKLKNNNSTNNNNYSDYGMMPWGDNRGRQQEGNIVSDTEMITYLIKKRTYIKSLNDIDQSILNPGAAAGLAASPTRLSSSSSSYNNYDNFNSLNNGFGFGGDEYYGGKKKIKKRNIRTKNKKYKRRKFGNKFTHRRRNK